MWIYLTFNSYNITVLETFSYQVWFHRFVPVQGALCKHENVFSCLLPMWDLHNPDHTCKAFKLEEKSAQSLGRKNVHAKSDFQLVSKELVTSTLSISSFSRSFLCTCPSRTCSVCSHQPRFISTIRVCWTVSWWPNFAGIWWQFQSDFTAIKDFYHHLFGGNGQLQVQSNSKLLIEPRFKNNGEQLKLMADC